ncbi:MAG: hypothetical protein VXW58_00130 [Pseudomonadota bacterium]|nr:hypothetical protein [Pseudomonadota bacterium]
MAATMLAASVAPALSDTFKRITTEEKFRELVVDRKAVSEAGWFLVKSDGSTSGNIFKKTFKGAWVWKNRMYCRNAVLGNETLKTDCQVVKISGDQVQFIRDYGKGATGTSTLE